ncbi:MAG: hypothetical protein AAF639_41355 [Chloroflexota bacterium]
MLIRTVSSSKVLNMLQQYKDSGQLAIYYIDAPPRTAGSALHRAIAQATDADAYEPFHIPPNAFMKGLEGIHAQVEAALARPARPDKPVRIVVKEIARYLNEEEWQQWSQLVDHFVFVVRDPLLQLYSMVLRTANDWHAGYGSHQLSDAEAWAQADQIGRIFRDGGTVNGRPIPPNFERLSWQSLETHLTLLDQQMQQIQQAENRVTIVDSSLLRADPKAQMTELFSRLQLPTDDATLTRCVSGWHVGHVQRDDCPQDDAYRNKVNSAQGLMPPLDNAPLFTEMPRVFQQYLVDIALPTYQRFLARKEMLGPKTPKALWDVFMQWTQDTCLLAPNALTAYGLIANLQRLSSSERQCQARLLTNLSMSYPYHQNVFTLLRREDEWCSQGSYLQDSYLQGSIYENGGIPSRPNCYSL